MKVRYYISVRGAVQGVGFRPFIYRAATALGLRGFVRNCNSGVIIEAEGEKQDLEQFIEKVESNKPERSFITHKEITILEPAGYTNFQILESEKNGEVSALVLPDIGTCPDCLSEMFDSRNRRYLYPFINCTNCGPRYSIIEKLPYDRENTTMREFSMCSECLREYNDPGNRRYHAEPIGCPECGPRFVLTDKNGVILKNEYSAIIEACSIISNGEIVALKGIGGFQLLSGCSDESISRLRRKKQRDEKPFAVMLPDIETVRKYCYVNNIEEKILLSPESPIVLLRKKPADTMQENLISENVAPGNPYLGVMLPYSPTHYLLMNNLKIPVVATSGNISEEPMCIDNSEALTKLGGIADYFLMHNRAIVRYIDDSVLRVIKGRELMLRRARGYAPLPVTIGEPGNIKKNNMFSFGAHLKNTIALRKNDEIFISQHIGNLETSEAINSYNQVIDDFKNLFNTEPDICVCDLHPDYISTKIAEKEIKYNKSLKYIQHHVAHVASCRAENRVKGRALGVAWDGTGFGVDGRIWGGEFFTSEDNSIRHVAQLRQFPLPGGDKATREPRRSTAGILYEIYGKSVFHDNKNPGFLILKNIFNSDELLLLQKMLVNKLNCPMTSSMGRLFDAVSSLTGLLQKSNYEGQAAMMLEFSCLNKESANNKNAVDYSGFYDFNISDVNIKVVNWQPVIEQILVDIETGTGTPVISEKFHNTLVEIIFKIASGLNFDKIILSGGCFQNAMLTEKAIDKLEAEGIKVYMHQRVPPNDGGISLGQIVAGAYED